MIFYLEGSNLGLPELHVIEIFNQTTFHRNLVILAFIGAELAWGADSVPPSFARNGQVSRRGVFYLKLKIIFDILILSHLLNRRLVTGK